MTAYRYDSHGNLIEQRKAELGRTYITGYRYNAQGQRTRKELPGKKPQVIIYHYDLNGQLLAETTGNGKAIKAYVWLYSRPLAQLDGKDQGKKLSSSTYTPTTSIRPGSAPTTEEKPSGAGTAMPSATTWAVR